MHPSFILGLVAIAALALVTTESPAKVGLREAEYATIMASMSVCGLELDMAELGRAMHAEGIDPKSQDAAERIGELTWEESQRVFVMSTSEQAQHCAQVRERVAELGLD